MEGIQRLTMSCRHWILVNGKERKEGKELWRTYAHKRRKTSGSRWHLSSSCYRNERVACTAKWMPTQAKKSHGYGWIIILVIGTTYGSNQLLVDGLGPSSCDFQSVIPLLLLFFLLFVVQFGCLILLLPCCSCSPVGYLVLRRNCRVRVQFQCVIDQLCQNQRTRRLVICVVHVF